MGWRAHAAITLEERTAGRRPRANRHRRTQRSGRDEGRTTGQRARRVAACDQRIRKGSEGGRGGRDRHKKEKRKRRPSLRGERFRWAGRGTDDDAPPRHSAPAMNAACATARAHRPNHRKTRRERSATPLNSPSSPDRQRASARRRWPGRPGCRTRGRRRRKPWSSWTW